MHAFIQDVLFSFRLMRKRPGTSFLVIAALVLGMGLNTAVFSVVNAVLLRPLPIFEPDRVVWLHSRVNQTGAQLATAYSDFLDWRAQSRSFDAMAAMYFSSFTLTGNGPPEHVKVIGISAPGFKVWGITPVLGRDFTERDDQPGANRVTILSYPFWQRKFGGDSAVLNKGLILDGQQYIVIGVLQPTPLKDLSYPDLYVTNGPLLNAHLMERDTRWFFPVARLKKNATLAQAQAEMETITSRLATQYPATNKDMGIRVEGLADRLTADGRKPLTLLLAASSLIFLLAVVNVLIVFMSSATERATEFSVRLALGASRAVLLRQLFAQSLIFALIGAVLGLLLAKLTLAFFLQRFPTAFLRFQETTIDLRVIALTFALALVMILFASLIPAVYASRINIGSKLRGERGSLSRPKLRLLGRSALVLTEVALASALSLISALLIKSFYEVEKVDLGFSPQNILSFQVSPPVARYKQQLQQSALYRTAREKLANLPGMNLVSGISSLPLTGQALVNTMDVGQDSPLASHQLIVEQESILPGFFRTVRLPLLQGRDFRDADYEGTPPVAIVDDILAAKLWPSESPLGKRIHISTMTGEPIRWLEVVGVVREIKHSGPERDVKWMQVYVPQFQDPSPTLSFVVNTTLSEGAAKTAAEKAIRDLDANLPVENFATLDSYLDKNYLSGRKVNLVALSSFAGIGITLGIIGIYAIVANSVTQRRRELAIRIALGATPSSTAILASRLGLLSALAGIAVGAGLVISLTRVFASMLFGVSPLDPNIYALTAICIVLLTLLASAIPAIELFRLNVQEILRH